MVPVGVHPPPNSAFLDRETFVWGLDVEQGAFEWLAEDWGHGEGQGQERVALCWPPAGLQATPNTTTGVGRRAAGTKPRRGYYQEGGVQDRERGFGGQTFAGGCLLGAERTGPPPPPTPLLSREAGMFTQLHDFLYVTPSGNFSILGPRLG